MIKEIKYNGYTAVPSDYECPDGDLALSLNLINEDGAISPILPHKTIRTYDVGYTPVYIHKVNNVGITILRSDSVDEISFHYCIGAATDPIISLAKYKRNVDSSEQQIRQVSSLGNVLMVLAESGIDHFIWDVEMQKYKPLGNAIPDIALSFGLQGKIEYSDEYEAKNFSVLASKMYEEWDEDYQPVITQQVMAKVNKFIVDKATNSGRFIFPFFVRYALRLYDDTLVNHSAPILMHAASGETPNVLALSLDKQDGGDNHYEKMRYRIAAICHKLDYAIISPQENINALKTTWKDLVKSVDIFISAPIYTFDQNGLCKRFLENDNDDLRSTCRIIGSSNPDTNYADYTSRPTYKLYRGEFYNKIHDDFKPHFNRRCQLPLINDTNPLPDKIKSNSQFFLLKSINIDELALQRTIIDIPDDYLGALIAREAMTDDYDSHDQHIATIAYDYNSRINIANVKKRIYPGFSIKNSTCYNNAVVTTYRVLYYIKDNGRTIITEAPDSTFGDIDSNLFLYHPNPNAFKAIIYRKTSAATLMLECPLRQHDFLVGSYFFNEASALPWKQTTSSAPEIKASPISEQFVSATNKIYTSAVNNPFVFPVTNITTVGSGKILGLSTAAKALSQGQFGQFPLYAFTDEGVWALEVSTTGSYSARQPITHDVCINPGAITQIDSGVIFPTDRGLMLISGSQTQCISEPINSITPVTLLDLPQFGEHLLSKFTPTDPVDDRLMPLPPLTSLLKDCGMTYDYINQRIVLFFPNLPYSYIFSLKSQSWGMMYVTFKRALNSYPDALAVSLDNKIVDLSRPADATAPVRGLLVTRPLKLDAADILKTVDTVIQRGNFHKGHVQSVLYGSRDLHSWHLVWSSKDHYLRGFRGTPYKYFRIAVIATLNAYESIYGASVQFTPRLTNQPR